MEWVADHPVGSQPCGVTTGDFNGDGDLDAATGNYGSGSTTVLLGSGNGNFYSTSHFGSGHMSEDIQAADLDDDGDLDLIVAVASGGVRALFNDGQGQFDEDHWVSTGVQPYRIAVSDLDDDGDPDVAVANFIHGIVSILSNPGDGLLEVSGEYPIGHQVFHMHAIDLNEDGLDELVMEGAVLWNTSGSFTLDVREPTSEFPIAFADFDGDGDSDGVFPTTTSVMSVRENLGDWELGPHEWHTLGGRIRGGCSGDLDQNGSPDVVVTTGPWTGGPGGAVTVLMHRPPAPVTIRVPDDVPSIGEAVAISVDGDTIEVGPGTWHEQVDVQGRAVVLTATSGPEHTTLQGVGGEVIRAVSGESAATVFEGFTIRGGTGFEGGGAYISNGSPTFRRCRFIGNNATYGSGLYVVDGSPRLEHCLIKDNTAAHGAGIWKIEGGVMQLDWCGVIDNWASVWGGGAYCNGIAIGNSVVCGNSPDDFVGDYEDLGGNVFDPQWCEFDCDNSGYADGWEILQGSLEDCNSNGVADVCEILNGVPDENENGVPDECDCREDLNETGVVDISDLLMLLANWGASDVIGDLNEDGIIDINDMLLVLNAWGPCE